MMGRRTRSSTFAAAALLAMALAASPAPAAEPVDPPSRTETLDGLFAKLKTADTEVEADLVTTSIWRVWLDSGSATIDLLTRRASEAIKAEELDAAVAILDEVVTLAPDYAEGWNKRATVHFMLNNYDASVHDIRRTLALEPRHFGALSGLAAILRETEQLEPALRIYREALGINPHLKSAREAIDELAVEVEGREI